jgi:carbonic anhydrase/acetyltransferase-like protein (isoleucine patch superfamily)
MENNKYELTDETITTPDGVVLHRIRACRSFADVKAGDLGGFIQEEKNLDTTGDAWVADSAQVYGDAQVFGNARVSGDARVSDHARVSGDARVSDHTWIYDHARVSGDAHVSGDARVSDHARVYDHAWIYDHACVSDHARIYGQAWIYGQAYVSDHAWIYGQARVTDQAHVYDQARVSGHARVSGQARVSGDTWKISPLQIQGTAHFLTVSSYHEITIGCECHPVTDWLEKYETIGKRYGYSEQQLQEYVRYIRMAAGWMEMLTGIAERAGDDCAATCEGQS